MQSPQMQLFCFVLIDTNQKKRKDTGKAELGRVRVVSMFVRARPSRDLGSQLTKERRTLCKKGLYEYSVWCIWLTHSHSVNHRLLSIL